MGGERVRGGLYVGLGVEWGVEGRCVLCVFCCVGLCCVVLWMLQLIQKASALDSILRGKVQMRDGCGKSAVDLVLWENFHDGRGAESAPASILGRL